MSDKDEVAARLQRVNYRLQSCWTQRSRLEEEIAALQKKREFLLSLGGGGQASATQATDQVEVSTSRFLPQVISPQYRPQQRRLTADELLRRAQTGVEQLQGATQEMVKATQSIVTTLDIVKNVMGLISPAGRQQLGQIAQGLFGALSGAAAPPTARVSTLSTGGSPTGQSQAGDGTTTQSTDILGLLSYITSPAFFDLLSSFVQPQQPAGNGGNATQ